MENGWKGEAEKENEEGNGKGKRGRIGKMKNGKRQIGDQDLPFPDTYYLIQHQ